MIPSIEPGTKQTLNSSINRRAERVVMFRKRIRGKRRFEPS